jgi:uncharacterized protein (DUF608 family)
MADSPEPTTPRATETTDTLLLADPEARRALLDPAVVDVSHGEGIPIGCLGGGHSLFGRHGFQRLAFDAAPDMGPEYEEPRPAAPFAFYLFEGARRFTLQERPALKRRVDETALEPRPVTRVFAYAELPRAHFRFEEPELELGLVLSAFSPLVEHDLEASTTPVQIFDFSIENASSRERSLELWLSHVEGLEVRGDVAVHTDARGELAFLADGGRASPDGVSFELRLAPGELCTVRFLLAWHYPSFRTLSPVVTAEYRRYYAARFADAAAVLATARARADGWSRAIDAWHQRYRVPAPMKRLWFSSLASVITSTMLSDDPYFFALEVPHEWVNTMDVAVYANWVYLVNWPELEKWDLEQYFSVIPTQGEQKGFVWHSIWSDAAHYAEEPTFLTRLFRAHLWFDDTGFLERGYEHAVNAANCALARDSFEGLLNSKRGNQSYDEWMMPGVSSYVNVTWLYALHALERIAGALGKSPSVGGQSPQMLRQKAAETLSERLWTEENGGYYRCFFRTPGSSDASVPDAVFTDQLFGRWVLLIDRGSARVLDEERTRRALLTIYENNLLDDPASRFRGWVNGMLPGGKPDMQSGYHSRTCWFGAQLDLASLLGAVGEEAHSLDVWNAVEASLHDYHLAPGEWNRSVDANGRAVVLPEEARKDTPRFPPYPRYTSSWEYLVRMLGLTLDGSKVHLDPFRTLSFSLDEVRLAGVTLSVDVTPNYRRALVNGAPVALPVVLDRNAGPQRVEYLAD